MHPVRAIRAAVGWTQAELARAAATSQPTIAAYETGAKSPTWRTVERLAAAAGLACYPFVGPPMTRDQERSLVLHRHLAERLVADPRRVLSTARRTLATMEEANPGAKPLLEEWSRIIDRPLEEVVSQLLDPSEHGRDLRQVTPFAGVLSARERAAIVRSQQSAA
ncbi:MAG TPA: helix-turn-helix transcriptional regulator [Microthrixaceae bacterium]|nr:helix-turn-helix transcriptional regulator [Microthrixaceae bacterium]